MDLDRFPRPTSETEPEVVGNCAVCGHEIWAHEVVSCPNEGCENMIHQGCAKTIQCKCGQCGCRNCMGYDMDDEVHYCKDGYCLDSGKYL